MEGEASPIETLPSGILGEQGLFAASIEGFKPRKPQMEMADAVAEAFEQYTTLVAEAGTGTGKTYAYLLPALLSGKRIIISTGTKNLQDQLYHRDLPVVRDLLEQGSVTALLKGRSNYLCLHRLELTEDQGRFYSRRESAKFTKIRRWASETDTGDIAEMSGVEEGDLLWPRVTSTADNCLGQECSEWDRCHVVNARRRAQEADLVVVNHHLFFADMALKEEGFGELLPGANAVVFDEAHQLAEVATSFFGERISHRQLLEWADDTQAEYLSDAPDYKPLQEGIDQLKKGVADFRLALDGPLGRYTWQQLTGRSGIGGATEVLTTAINTLTTLLQGVAERGKGLSACAERGAQLLDRYHRLTITAPPGQIHWAEIHKSGFSIHHTPLEIRDTFQGYMEGRKCGWLFTSATLTVDGQFDHFLQEFGIEEATTARWDSPFDFQKQALFFHPTGLPQPNAPEYGEKMMEKMVPVIEASQGRTFMLFTSHKALRAAAEYLRDGAVEFPLLVQGESPRSQLLERFRQLGNAVLLGASSFWEGVDVRGEALSCVIIDKFPFASPGDPVLQARIQALNSSGRNAFMELQLPRAVIALRQGAGRLIRSVEDRGVFVVCDPRLLKKGYGHTFLNSLPDMARSREVTAVEQFFAVAEERVEELTEVSQ
ncbi:MAG: ATP-dependent DNA helicase [Gammaproteobacteria bacterium]|jgi:ATP-dependent DNA helicase DinG|nr:ATP-dependent DNA helicase [Gammaproteobacteria bacterium]MBT3490539.1 ATP-dependent DNA helicase [Gammaproteobacteria bacterium]MBT3717920.1 ATP-dependent DNA helicase [Gammaproteobacteria bacterium]MBT3844972.1 ATP-dependent DNA helicase [Gammaproteobacteria bacterium]MBT4300327.1 ATP-dependent DNA helicase [Gammaproteobacteria bacterium]